MIRDINDPRIVEVVAVFHRHAGSTVDGAAEQTEQYLSAIMSNGYPKDGMLSDWPMDGLLAVLMAYLQHAPEDELDDSVAVARAQLASLLNLEHTFAIERATGDAFGSRFDYPTQLKRERALVSKTVRRRKRAA